MNSKQYQEIGLLLERITQSKGYLIYQNWIAENFSHEIIALLPQLTHNDFKILDLLNCSNLTISQVAQTLKFSQGGVSRRIILMNKKQLIEKYHLGKNKRRVYLKLTNMGESLVEFHKQFHQHIKEKTLLKTENFSNHDIEVVITFLRALL